MRRLGPSIILCLLLTLVTTGAACGGGGGKSIAEELAEWVSRWSGAAARGESRPPPVFKIPAPPVGELATAATQLGDEVGSARTPLADFYARSWSKTTEQATSYTQGALCEWFSWYVESPADRPVPDGGQFLYLFAKGALGVTLVSPAEVDVKNAVELFRNAIKRGQNLTEDTRNAAMAAACSVPL